MSRGLGAIVFIFGLLLFYLVAFGKLTAFLAAFTAPKMLEGG